MTLAGVKSIQIRCVREVINLRDYSAIEHRQTHFNAVKINPAMCRVLMIKIVLFIWASTSLEVVEHIT